MLLLALMQVFQAVSRLVVLVELSKLLQPAVSIAFYSNKTSIGRAITFCCTTRFHLSVHSLALPHSGSGDDSCGGGTGTGAPRGGTRRGRCRTSGAAENLAEGVGGSCFCACSQQVREVMTVNQEMTDESSWIWLTTKQMGFPLWSEFANENHGEAGSSKQCNDQRTDQNACFLAPIITDFIRNTKRELYDEKLYDEKLEDALEMLNLK